MKPLYFDHHSTTPLDQRVFEVMKHAFAELYGNAASSTHPLGWAAQDAVQKAREQVAAFLGVQPREIVFTSGATESDNLALKGFVRAQKAAGKSDVHVVTTALEHKAILDSCTRLESEGVRVTRVMPEKNGVVAVQSVLDALEENTVLVSVMLANNEVGAIQPIDAISKAVKSRGIAFHSDAVQGIGHVPFSMDNVDLLSFTAHKIYGPKGVGALYVRRRPKVRLQAMLDGGGHEGGRRSGTLNVPGIVGFGEACAIMAKEGRAEAQRVGALRDDLEKRLRHEVAGAFVNGPAASGRLGNNLNIGFERVPAERLILKVQQALAFSSGSACTTQSIEPSHVLRAMQVPHDKAHCSIRLGLGRGTTEEDVERCAEILTEAIAFIRA